MPSSVETLKSDGQSYTTGGNVSTVVCEQNNHNIHLFEYLQYLWLTSQQISICRYQCLMSKTQFTEINSPRLTSIENVHEAKLFEGSANI